MNTTEKDKPRHGHAPKSWAEAAAERDKEVAGRISSTEGKGLNAICSRHHYWGPWLLMRGCDTDRGARPTTLPYYLSPDILVESGDPYGRAIAGRPNFVWARIWNLHRFQASPVKVDFFWANPAVGLGPGFVNPISGNHPEWTVVPALSQRWVRCATPWFPEFLNDGHECLFVNCDDHLLDPILHPSQPIIDRHAGQRNITVIPAPPGHSLRLNLEFSNILPYASHGTLMFRSEHLALRTPLGAAAHAGALAARELKEPAPPGLEFHEAMAEMVAFGLTQEGPRPSQRKRQAIRATRPLSIWRPPECGDQKPPEKPERVVQIDRPGAAVAIRAEIGADVAIRDFRGADAYAGELMLARDGTRFAAPERNTVLQRLQMRAFEQRQLMLEITVPAAARPGEFVVCHVTQENDGLLLGGYALVVAVTPSQEG
jgi:hypothetical protein